MRRGARRAERAVREPASGTEDGFEFPGLRFVQRDAEAVPCQRELRIVLHEEHFAERVHAGRPVGIEQEAFHAVENGVHRQFTHLAFAPGAGQFGLHGIQSAEQSLQGAC